MALKLPSLLLTGSLLALAAAAQAQATFSIGPRLGLNLSNAPFKDQSHNYSTATRAGAEAGIIANIGFGHFAVQPALLYSQKGFIVDDTYTLSKNNGSFSQTNTTTLLDEYRLNYFTVPLNFVYAQHPDGQGVQVYAGPYFGLLANGQYSYDDRYEYQSAFGTTLAVATNKSSGDVGAGDYYTTNRTDTKFYSRSKDAGLQFGLGYRKGGFLVQAGYSVGLRNMGADFKVQYGPNDTRIVPGPSYYNRVFQFSLAYLVGPKS